MKQLILFLFALVQVSLVAAQSGVIKGKVFDELTREPLAFANLALEGTTIGATTDIDGNFKFEGLQPGIVNVQVTYVGYQAKTVAEVRVTNNNPAVLEIEMTPLDTKLEEVVIRNSPFVRKEESPVSLRTIGIAEIERSPGSNRDISKVIQSLPGVAQGVAFRNDLIIRGGGPNENRFFLEDVETPNINHFATQGASGGPVGMIDVNYIREVDFYSGAFPANTYNALSSVMRFKFREPRDDRIGLRATVGASDFGLAVEGPLGKKTSFFLSSRRSYLNCFSRRWSCLSCPSIMTYSTRSNINLTTRMSSIPYFLEHLM